MSQNLLFLNLQQLTANLILFSYLTNTHKQCRNYGQACITGKRQSPISLRIKHGTPVNVEPLVFDSADVPLKAEATNTGRTIKLTITDNTLPQVNGGGLQGAYKLDNIHFHWDAEHIIDNVRHALESHMVFYSTKFKNAAQAAGINSLAIFATTYAIGEKFNPSIDSLADIVPSIRNEVDKPKELLRRISLDGIMSPDRQQFFRYKGSLTTPPYSENALWTVFIVPQVIQRQQLLKIKDICTEYGCPVVKNYRQLQDDSKREKLVVIDDNECKK